MTRMPNADRSQQLRAAIASVPRASDDEVAAKYSALLKLGNPLEFARQTYEDRASLVPGQLVVPPSTDFDRDVLRSWHGGGTIPAELTTAFVEWRKREQERTYAIGELERRLRGAVCAYLTLAQSPEEGDKRRALGFASWLRTEWQVVDLKPARDPQGAIAIEEEITSAVRRRAGR